MSSRAKKLNALAALKAKRDGIPLPAVRLTRSLIKITNEPSSLLADHYSPLPLPTASIYRRPNWEIYQTKTTPSTTKCLKMSIDPSFVDVSWMTILSKTMMAQAT